MISVGSQIILSEKLAIQNKNCGVTSPINRIYPLWGASPSRFIGSSPSVDRTNQGLDLVVVIASPTSVRVPSHIWFIRFWSDHMCTTTTHGDVTPQKSYTRIQI